MGSWIYLSVHMGDKFLRALKNAFETFDILLKIKCFSLSSERINLLQTYAKDQV